MEYIYDLRNEAAHLLVAEVKTSLSEIFQAGVLNYTKRYEQVTGEPLLKDESGFTLVSSTTSPSRVILTNNYGPELAKEIISFIDRVEQAKRENDSDQFRVSVEIKLALTKQSRDADACFVSNSDSNTKFHIVDKPVQREKLIL